MEHNIHVKNNIVYRDCSGILLYIANRNNNPFKFKPNRFDLFVNTAINLSDLHIRENYKKLKRN